MSMFSMFSRLFFGAGVLFCVSAVAVASSDPVVSIKGLVSRVIGNEYVDKFSFEVIGEQGSQDVFEIDADLQMNRPAIRGNNGVSLASGFNWYLKYFCNCSVSWGRNGSGDQLHLPSVLPLPDKLMRMSSPHKYRYYQNVCTVSYSMVWWDWHRWEREIDWMAMNGLNLILSFTGQEYVWRNLYMAVGLTSSEIEAFFSGPAFLAWQRMGNIQGWAGPLDGGWILRQRDLQKQIVERIRQFGMINVFPGFAGHVPKGLQRVFPKANLTKNANWGRFGSNYSEDYLLEPTDPLFFSLGKQYYDLLISEYGSDHVFNADTYNEMDPSDTSYDFLAETNYQIYRVMETADAEAIFLMQGWLFHSGFWKQDRIKAFLSKVPDNKMIILDLNSEASPVYTYTNSYYGKPYIWCLLHNYGGQRGIYGNLTRITTGPIEAKRMVNSTMIGTGITPEAIEHNPVVFDLMGEMGWRNAEVKDIMSWLDTYVARRYGNWTVDLHAAWEQLFQNAYQNHWGAGIEAVVVKAPDFYYNPSREFHPGKLAEAWRYLLKAINSGDIDRVVPPLKYDVVDIGRQFLTNTFTDLYTLFVKTYLFANKTGMDLLNDMEVVSSVMLEVITDIDLLLASDPNFLLGGWICDARSSAPTNTSEALLQRLEFNARNQITMWGPNQNIEDYAAKQWSGTFSDYYMHRWELFLEGIIDSVKAGEVFNKRAYEEKRFQFESAWSSQTNVFPDLPHGDSIMIAMNLLKKYLPDMSDYVILSDSNVEGGDLYGQEVVLWTGMIDQIVWFCEFHPQCVGFTYPRIFFKSTATRIVFDAGTILYLKKQ